MTRSATAGAWTVSRRGLLAGAAALAAPNVAAAAAFDGPEDGAEPAIWPTLSRGPDWLSLDQGWRFHWGDIPQTVTGHRATVNSAKAGGAVGAAAPNFDDTEWREVQLPHDWVVEGPFSQDANIAQGYRPRGVGWYRRAFQLGSDDRDRCFELQLEGIAARATIWLNGTLVGRSWSGYTASYIDATPHLRFGDHPNVISIRVDAEPNEGWWYEGGGIYRRVWLVRRPPVHVASDGLYVSPRAGPDGRWRTPIETIVRNAGSTAVDASLRLEVLDPSGRVIASATDRLSVPALAETKSRTSVDVDAPALWSLESPAMHRLRAAVSVEGAPEHVATTDFGFRTMRFDADRGFFLNDRPVKIKGACIHQDHAGVGVAVPEALLEHRLRLLKRMGANAVRMSHHPSAREMLPLCDRLGILVLDEHRSFNTDRDTLEQLRWLVRRDRNHPSVFLWSIFNEEPLQGTAIGHAMARRMMAEVRALDDLRPVTAAMHGGLYGEPDVSDLVDVVGLNYQRREYDAYRKAYPDRPMLSTEDTSAFMTRGVRVTDRARNVFADDDTEAAAWGSTNRQAWKDVADRPFLAGGFIWTGFDYRGEPTPFTWPSASTVFGAMDLCGFPKTGFHIRRALWRPQPFLRLAPHWTWPGLEGQPIKVLAVTNMDEVELLLNGQPLGRSAVKPYEMARFEIAYRPGRLEAVGYRGGRRIARFAVETAGPPVGLALSSPRPWLHSGRREALPVRACALDSRGREVPTAGHRVQFATAGGRVIGVGNGDPTDHDPEVF